MSSQLYQFLLKKGLEPRKAQEEFFSIVHKTIEEGSISIVQAPTGTGKTYGYLIPIIERGEKAWFLSFKTREKFLRVGSISL